MRGGCYLEIDTSAAALGTALACVDGDVERVHAALLRLESACHGVGVAVLRLGVVDTARGDNAAIQVLRGGVARMLVAEEAAGCGALFEHERRHGRAVVGGVVETRVASGATGHFEAGFERGRPRDAALQTVAEQSARAGGPAVAGLALGQGAAFHYI